MRAILHPIFLASRDLATTPYWKKIFENLAYGETPRGIYFRGSEVYSITKKKEFAYNFCNDGAEEIFVNISKFFGYIYGLKASHSPIQKDRDSPYQTDDEWNKIKKKSIRENLIQDFVIRMKKEFNLPDPEMHRAYFYISVGLVFKLFLPSDVKLKLGTITAINGIDFTPEKSIITRFFKEPVIKKQAKGVWMKELWAAYLKSRD